MAATVRVALRRPDRHALGGGDLLERPLERVLEDDDLRLRRRDLSEAGAELRPRLGELRGALGVGVDGLARVLLEGIASARALALEHVLARVHEEPVEPRRELRLSAELLQPDAELRERLLRRV